MCIVVSDEELEAERQHWIKVSKTNIFARHTGPGQQVLAYSMSIASSTPAAMILPLPVSRPSGEDAVRFIDLSGIPDFFDHMARGCQAEYQEDEFGEIGAGDLLCLDEIPALTVHDVGDFEASYVPSMGDFTRLDPRFRLPDEVWQSMPDYSDYGFAVFQLKLRLMTKEAEVENEIHPLALEFSTRDSKRLYFPTVHVHDGAYHDSAGFYHRFYCQRENARSEFKYWWDVLQGFRPRPARVIGENFPGYRWLSRSSRPASEILPVDDCEGLVDPDLELHSLELHGEYKNQDIWLGDSL